MARVRVSTTVDADLLERVRALFPGSTDSSLLESAFAALVREQVAREIDRQYERAYAVPSPSVDAWGDVDGFLDEAARA